MDDFKNTIILLKMIVDLMKSVLDFFQAFRKRPRNGRRRSAATERLLNQKNHI